MLISPWPDQEGNKLMFLSERREFPSAPCLAEKKNLMTARVSMLLKSRASLTCFRDCFLPGRARDLSASRYCVVPGSVHVGFVMEKLTVGQSLFFQYYSFLLPVSLHHVGGMEVYLL